MTRLLDREHWLAHLPTVVEEVPVDLVLVGVLLPASANRVRVVSGELCLTFASADVVDVEQYDDQRGEWSGTIGQVRLIVRRGAALWDVCPRECVAALMPPGRRPFAMSSRLDLRAKPGTRFAELEDDFLAGVGLRPAKSP